MASVIKRAAAEQLQASLEGLVASLVGKIHIWQQPADKIEDFPCLAILAKRFRLIPFQEDPVDETVDGVSVISIGEVEGLLELVLATEYDVEREELEDRINHAFYQDRAGVLVAEMASVQVNDVVTTYDAPVAFSYSDEDWRDEMIFSNERRRTLDVEVTFPALIRRTGTVAKRIDHLILGLTHDLTSDVPDESVEALQDGSIIQPTV